MQRLARLGLVAALCGAALAAPAAHASTSYQLRQAGLVARTNGTPLAAGSLELMWRHSRLRDADISQADVLAAMISNRLMADYVRRHYAPGQLFDGARVAFSSETENEMQTVALLRSVHGKALDQAVRALPGGNLNGVVGERAALDAAYLDGVLGPLDKRLLLDFAFTAGQRAAAQQAVLLQYQLPGGSRGAVTLLDVYARQNVQGRVEIQQRNVDFIGQQARAVLANRFVLDWAERTLGARVLEDARAALDDQAQVKALQAQYGIGADMHAPQPMLKTLADKVTQAEIRAYYDSHKDEFRRIEKVKARHVRVASEAAAQRVYQEAAGGADFAELARARSIAGDRAQGGDLGWIEHTERADWLAQLAMLQPPGVVGQPVRSPVGPNEAAYWEIMLVERRIEGYQPPGDDSVRYAASQAIAQRKAVAAYGALREQLAREARVEISPDYAPAAAPGPGRTRRSSK